MLWKKRWGGYANLIYGKGGTCEAYAGAYHYLCELTGITVDEAATENHIWNQIKINGKWYNVDTTNDDSCNDDPLSNEVEFFNTEYFMKSDRFMKDIKDFMVNEANSHNNDYEYWSKLWSEVNHILWDLREKYNDNEIMNAVLNEIGAKKALTIMKKIKANGVYPK